MNQTKLILPCLPYGEITIGVFFKTTTWIQIILHVWKCSSYFSHIGIKIFNLNIIVYKFKCYHTPSMD